MLRYITSMKHIHRLALLLLLAFSLNTAQAQETTRRDGNWWRSQGPSVQISYMVGFFDGMELGHHFSYWSFVADKKAGAAVKRVSSSYDEHKRKYFNNVTNVQLVDGLNAFYADFKNRSILVHDAVWLVVIQISGLPQEQFDSMVENWRRSSKN